MKHGLIAVSGQEEAERPAQYHSTSVVESSQVGAGTRIWYFCHVMPDAQIGEDCNIGQNVFVDNGAKVGSRCKLQNNVSIYRCVELEDDVFVGPSAVFTNVLNPRCENPRDLSEYRRTLVGKGTTIGANATIVCGAKIGHHAFVGAGAVVTGDVAPHSLVLGVPARVQPGKIACTCGELASAADAKCHPCGRMYRQRAGGGWEEDQ